MLKNPKMLILKPEGMVLFYDHMEVSIFLVELLVILSIKVLINNLYTFF